MVDGGGKFCLACWCLIGLVHGMAPADGPAAEPPPRADQVRVAGIVLKWVRGDKEANYRRAEPMIRSAAAQGAKIVLTTECFLDGYAIADKSIPLETFRALGETIPGGTYFERLANLARELKIYLAAGMAEADGEQRYNTVVLLSPEGRLLARYRKQKLGHEHVRNTPGSDPTTAETPYGRLGFIICADRTDPEIVRKTCSKKVDLLLCPSGGMFGPVKNDPIVQSRSRENGIPIVFVHPAEFLVTGGDGSFLSRTVLGDRLLVTPAEVGTDADSSRIFLIDLELPKPRAATNASR